MPAKTTRHLQMTSQQAPWSPQVLPERVCICIYLQVLTIVYLSQSKPIILQICQQSVAKTLNPWPARPHPRPEAVLKSAAMPHRYSSHQAGPSSVIPKGRIGAGLPLAARLLRRISPDSSVVSDLPARSISLISAWFFMTQRRTMWVN